MIGKPISDLIPPEYENELPQIMIRIESEECIEHYETVRRRKDGRIINVSLTVSPIYDSSGKVIGASTIARDFTERKRAEEELKTYREHLEDLVKERTVELEAANKELQTFSYSVSHDLRAPLRTIDGFGQALLEDYDNKLDAQGKDYLTRIRTATRHMAELIEDMLRLSRITRAEINIAEINLTEIAQSVIDELRKSEPQRNINIIIAEGLKDKADARLIRIALENLLGNAWKFTSKQPDALIEFGSTKEGKKTVYFIRDNGAGFNMSYVDKLFIPFQRLHTENEYPGTGIGLATVRRIIFRHGGTVWAEAQVGKGATFYFNIHG
jgi:light-regulated signal transduction histidine kinase (bacteriophytochrome)